MLLRACHFPQRPTLGILPAPTRAFQQRGFPLYSPAEVLLPFEFPTLLLSSVYTSITLPCFPRPLSCLAPTSRWRNNWSRSHPSPRALYSSCVALAMGLENRKEKKWVREALEKESVLQNSSQTCSTSDTLIFLPGQGSSSWSYSLWFFLQWLRTWPKVTAMRQTLWVLDKRIIVLIANKKKRERERE